MAEPPRANSIAVVGLAGRFPGAANVEQFWNNIVHGVESIASFSDDELLRVGAEPAWLEQPDFVKAAPVLDDVEQFDAGFFKIARREAEMMDPQQRILLELAWETLERAGYAGDAYRGLIGVFAGAGGLMSSYLLSPHHVHRRLIGETGSMSCIGNDKDYLSTRISYKLNLRGPSFTVQSACSTSLVAVHLACQSLLAGDCDMALAGGVTIRVPHRMGYFHSGQAILSPDGHCRAFDADAKGTVFGSGAGLVLLKPLARAVKDGDHIHAVIRGSAVNNDGAAKLSYWAASAEGQAAAAADAMAVAEVEPRSIGYVEAHGTATTMGDPVEIFGLGRAFRRGTEDRQFCAIGSVKTNIGHLEAAAGIAGLIKAILSLENKTLPPSLHFHKPNPAIPFPETPFYVNTECRPWEQEEKTLRRAAVNALGIGGTNAHVILEEAPPVAVAGAPGVRGNGDAQPSYGHHVLTLSAKTPAALDALAARYVAYFDQRPDACWADVCFTANVGRGHFAHRLAVAANSAPEARRQLAAWRRRELSTCAEGKAEAAAPPVVFLFSGRGSQHVGMGRELLATEPVFRDAWRRCDAVLNELRGGDASDRPSSALSPEGEGTGAESNAFENLTALFALQYALVELWKSWGVVPAAVLGHGPGEYAAACAAGVLSLEDALTLVAAEERLVRRLPPDGRMLAVLADSHRTAERVRSYAGDRLAVAAVNGPRQAVVAGRAETVEAFASQLESEGIRVRWLPGGHAFHTTGMAPILDEFAAACEKVSFQKPKIPWISGMSGRPADDETLSADYWRRRLCEPIRFAEGVEHLDGQNCRVFVEIGPQSQLLGLGRRTMRQWAGLWTPSLRPGYNDRGVLVSSLARLYARGVPFDPSAVDSRSLRRRVILPTYPFQRQRYWVEKNMPVIIEESKGGVRVMTIDLARMVETEAIEQCFREIAAAIDRSQEAAVLLDFSRVRFMSSMGLGMLIRVHKRCKQHKVALVLCGIASEIREVFKITGTDKIFDVRANAAEGLSAAAAAAGGLLRDRQPTRYEVK